MEYLASLLPMAVGSVDRLEEIPDRVKFIFAFDAEAAMSRPEVAEVLQEEGSRDVIEALPAAIHGSLLDREAIRAAATRVKERTGRRGKALFHPMRVALTGEGAGPELDLAVPAIDRGAALPPSIGIAAIMNCRDRAAAFAMALRSARL